MTEIKIERKNVGRLAERIVANELEARGFRVSDLNSDGLSANADLLASGYDVTRQIQVKGATNAQKDRWWVQYGYCTDGIIYGNDPVFNRRSSFYKADFVVLVAVRSTKNYRCIVLPVSKAEEAAQLNLTRGYRTPTLKGEKKKPGKIWGKLESAPREDRLSSAAQNLAKREREILNAHEDAWQSLV